MGIQTAAVLYPVNSTVLESGGAVDVRLLDSAQAGATESTQTATATHTSDNVARTFDPAGPNTNANEGPSSANRNRGYAVPLASGMTPDDDANCNACLTAGTITVSMRVAVNQSGGTYAGGTYGPAWAMCIWARDPAADTTPVQVGQGSSSATTWDYTPITGDLGTFKVVTFTIAISALYEFTEGHVFYVQYGLNTLTIPNPSVGTATWTYTLSVDDADTNITFDTGQGIRQLCTLALDATGIGTASQDTLTVGEFLEAIGVGTTDESHITAALVTLDAVGVGMADDTHTVTLDGAGEGLEAVGIGTADARLQIDFEDVPEGGGTTIRPLILFSDD